MNDQLVLLGRRVHELRAAKEWSQEEFAHVSGLHRTYIGQIERGEKNISFGNLLKISAVLGVSLSELLAGLEIGGASAEGSERQPQAVSHEPRGSADRMFEIQKVTKRLQVQRAAMDRTFQVLEDLAVSGVRPPKAPRGRAASRERTSRK